MVSVAPNHMFAWGLGTNHAIFWKYHHGGAYTAWTGWSTQGGLWMEDPVVASRGVNEAAIFLVDLDHALYHANYNFMADDGVSPFKSIGGELSGPPAVANRKGTLHIFYIGSDHALYHKSWDGTKYAPEDKFEKLGGLFIYSPAAVSAGPDEVSVFAVGLTDGRLHHYHWKSGAGWHPSQGGLFQGLTHVGALPGLWTGPPSAISIKEGSWDVFGVNAEGTINHVSFSDGSLSELEVLLGQKCQTIDSISVSPGTIDLIAWGLDCHAHHRRLDSKSSGEWKQLGGNFMGRLSPLSDTPGVLCVIGVGTDCAMYISSRDKDTGNWSGWSNIEGTIISRVA